MLLRIFISNMLVHEVRAFVLSAVAGLSLEHARERQLIDRAPAVPVGSYLLRPAILGMHQYNMPIFAPRCFESRELCRSHDVSQFWRAAWRTAIRSKVSRAPCPLRSVQFNFFPGPSFCFPIFLTRAVFLFPLVMPRTPRTHRRNAGGAATAERPQRDGTPPGDAAAVRRLHVSVR